jgi:phage-related minor tail protein
MRHEFLSDSIVNDLKSLSILCIRTSLVHYAEYFNICATTKKCKQVDIGITQKLIPTGMEVISAILCSIFLIILSFPLLRVVSELVRTLEAGIISKVMH